VNTRKWDELRAAGAELAKKRGNRGAIFARLHRVYELPEDEAEEAFAIFLDGLDDDGGDC
jgi:hypothetical protein